MKLYLAHPLGSRKEIREWELRFEKRTGIILVNPFYDLKRQHIIDLDNGKTPILNANDIVTTDIRLVKNSDALLAIIDKNTAIGTIQEIVYAFLDGKKVYSIVTNDMISHPFLIYHSTKIFNSLKDFENYITTTH